MGVNYVVEEKCWGFQFAKCRVGRVADIGSVYLVGICILGSGYLIKLSQINRSDFRIIRPENNVFCYRQICG